MLKGIVIIPTYNESGNIERIIPKVIDNYDLDILVVDDNSPDGTADLVRNMSGFGKRIFLLEREKKNGLGRAYIAGFQYALEKEYDYVVQMDADLSHDPKDLIAFVEAIEGGCDAVFGSRYVGGVRVLDWDVKRLMLSIGGNEFARITTGARLTDLTGGYNAYTSKVLKRINFDRIQAFGYMFQIEMKSSAYFGGFKVQEVPIVFIDRTIGETKMHANIIHEAIFGCLKIRFRRIFNTLPIKS